MLGGLAPVLIALLLTSAPARAGCDLSDGTLSLSTAAAEPTGGALIYRAEGAGLRVGVGDEDCLGVTVDNTDTIRYSDPVAGRETMFGLGVSFSPAGLIAPGRTDEGDGTSEIETFVDLGGDPGDSVSVSAGFDESKRDDVILVGQRGDTLMVNINAAEEPPAARDTDLTIDGLGYVHGAGRDANGNLINGSLRIQTLAGTDLVRARGDRTLGRVVTAPLDVFLQPGTGDKAVLGDGPDRLVGTGDSNVLKTKGGRDIVDGGGGRDRINPGRGKDEVEGGPGNDIIRARDGKRDRIDCGSGRRDKVIADRKDKVKRCRTVKRRG